MAHIGVLVSAKSSTFDNFGGKTITVNLVIAIKTKLNFCILKLNV